MSPPPKKPSFTGHAEDIAIPAPSCVMVEKEVIEEIRSGIQSLQTAMIGDRFGNQGLVKRVETLEGSDKANTQKFILWGGIVTGVSIAIQSLKTLLNK